MSEYVLEQEVNKLTIEEMKTSYYELEELGITGVLKNGIVRNIYNKSKIQNNSLSITNVQLAIYNRLIKELIK